MSHLNRLYCHLLGMAQNQKYMCHKNSLVHLYSSTL
nr:MAG TPA: hypothetical protein [Caudoviricetes sp.]